MYGKTEFISQTGTMTSKKLLGKAIGEMKFPVFPEEAPDTKLWQEFWKNFYRSGA